MKINTIYHNDCQKKMKEFPDNSIDLICTDPPYNISKNQKIVRNGGKFKQAKDINLNFGNWDFNKILPANYIDEFVRLLHKNGTLVLFYDKLYLGLVGVYLQDKYNFQVRHIGNWIKNNPAPQARKVKWMNGSESFLIATANKGAGHHFNYKLGQSPDYFRHSVNFEHLHPTQKPLKLINWIIKYWSFKNDLVLDPFLGSGTTAVSCKQLKRNFIGIEKNKKYYEIANKRLVELGYNKYNDNLEKENKVNENPLF